MSILTAGSTAPFQLIPHQICAKSGLTIHAPHSRNPRQIPLLRHPYSALLSLHPDMDTLWIPLRFIRTVQTEDLVPDKILSACQPFWDRLGPQTRAAIPITERTLKPLALNDCARKETTLGDLEPGRRGVGKESMAAWRGTGRHPDEHGPNCVNPGVVDCCKILPSFYWDQGVAGLGQPCACG
jgi:hypothetical protein